MGRIASDRSRRRRQSRPLRGPEVFLARRTLPVLAALVLALLAASVADGRSSRANACGAREYSYAGLQSDSKGHGVGATLVRLRTPAVSAGHVGAWIGVGGVNLGPNDTAEWLQVGFSAFPSDRMSRIYYEVTVPGSDPRYVELDSRVKGGEKQSFKVLEMANRQAAGRRPRGGPAGPQRESSPPTAPATDSFRPRACRAASSQRASTVLRRSLPASRTVSAVPA